MRMALAACVLLICATMGAASVAQAGEDAPDALLKMVTTEVLSIIRHDQDIRAGNVAKVATLVEGRILPLLNFTRMTQIALSRNWRLATPSQQQALITEFRTLLVRTYSTAISSYRDPEIEFRRLRAAAGDSEVTVKTIVKQDGVQPLTMDYDMERTAAGWKVYDIKIDGISLITTYQGSFASKIRDAGLDGLIKALSEKNRQGDARFRSQRTETFYLFAVAQSLMQGYR